MKLIRVRYKTFWKAGDCISVPLRQKYGIFHFPEPVEIRIGDTLYETKPDAVVIYKPDTSRWVYFPRDTHFHFLHVTEEIADLLDYYGIPVNCILYPDETDFLSSAFRKLQMEFLSQERNREEMISLCVRQLLINLDRQLHREGRKKIDARLQKKLRELRLEILSQPEKKWMVEDMARMVSLSASRFHVVYKAFFGISPVQDLINARVERAKELLLEEGDTLAVIAEKLGYKNQYDFSRQFTRVTGTAPGSYRRGNQ